MTAWFDSSKTVHVFLSYTSREEEVQLVQPIVDRYCAGLWHQARDLGLDVFYDHYSLEQRWYADAELEVLLDEHVSKAHMFVGFVSPAYVESRWCCFEWKRGPMREGGWFGRGRLPTQTVYWKPIHHDVQPYDQSVMHDLLSREYTDMQFAGEDPARYLQGSREFTHRRFARKDPARYLDAVDAAVREGIVLLVRSVNR